MEGGGNLVENELAADTAVDEPSQSTERAGPASADCHATEIDEPDRVLRFGDLVRIVGKQVGKPDNRGSLGKILRSTPISEANIDAKHLLSSHPFVYDVELILGGKLTGWQRPTLQYTTAAAEGMTGEARRRKRQQTNQSNDTQNRSTSSTSVCTGTTPTKKKQQQQGPSKKARSTKPNTSSTKRGKVWTTGESSEGQGGKSKRQKTTTAAKGGATDYDDTDNIFSSIIINSSGVDVFERHRREFERNIARLEKVDFYGFFTQSDVPKEFDETYATGQDDDIESKSSHTNSQYFDENTVVFPNHPPFNFVVLRKRMEMGRYILDQELLEVEDRIALIEPYYEAKNLSMPVTYTGQRKELATGFTVLHKKGINWDLFRMDIRGMCDQAVRRNSELVDDDGGPGTLSHSANKIKDMLEQIYEKVGKKQMAEIELSNDRYRFTMAIETSTNNEAAMQGKWKRDAFEERKYERLTSNVVCAGLSGIDERIAQYELNTSLKDSFLGLSYTYDDTGQSEGWMKTILNESGDTKEAASAAMAALESDDGVIKAQVSASMQALLIAVQDRVMTEKGVLSQPELRSANWDAGTDANTNQSVSTKQIISKAISKTSSMPDIIEQPVWGVDCYTRRNISICIETEFDSELAVIFIEKWLLPAINACPVDMAHNIHNAACILEGIPFDSGLSPDQPGPSTTLEQWGKTLLGAALRRKIQKTSPPWLASAAQLLRRAVASLGTDFFRIHPKGHGSIVLCPRIEPNRLVTFYRGEVYPSWRWGEKTDAISLIQERKGLKPRLPDFYNMALERPQTDPRGYGLMFVDASRKSGYGSMLSHSCTPSCEVRVAAVDGKVALAMTTLRELTIGDELTFDYNAVTESLHEYQEAVCLCGHGQCRGSFLHFATADCYQQVLNRNSPVAVRLSQLIKGSAKRVMSEDDSRVLKRHGFQTAAFGAVSVNRRHAITENANDRVLDSLDFVPIWLRTFVADVLRYIEYERRALPIALICNELEKGKPSYESDDSDNNDECSNESGSEEDVDEKKSKKDNKSIKGSKPEPTFFFFARKKRLKFLSVVMQQKENASLKGTALENQIKKVASLAWKELDEKSKSHWKSQAVAEWEANGGREKARLEEERLKRIALSTRQFSTTVQKSYTKDTSNSGKSSKKKKKESERKKTENALPTGGMSFQAADAEGVSAMEQRIQQLTQALSRVGRVLDRHREESLRKLGNDNVGNCMEDPAALRALVHSPVIIMSDTDVVAWMWNHPDGLVKSLLQLTESEICVSPSMRKHLRDTQEKYSALSQFGTPWDSQCDENVHLDMSGPEARETLNKALLEFRKVLLDGIDAMASEIRGRKKEERTKKGELEAATEAQLVRNEIKNLLVEMVGQVVESIDGPEATVETPGKSTMGPLAPPDSYPMDPWLENFNKRFKIEKAADLLLLYARTSTFFRLQTYEPLRSTPIEVYAREIGNSVPRSVMDIVEKSCRSQEASMGIEVGKSIVDEVKKTKPTGICAPEDIISEVVVEYQGDYVLSQLLQWYNAGIDQKPGLPDLLGCALLPSMPGCWTIDSTKAGSSASDRSTTYRLRTRPKLVEWLTDPHKRGNPWPDDIRRHFVEKENDKPIDNATNWIPFGSPVLDLLVTGDDRNILEILSKMGRSARSETSDGILSSVDEGRPAQAVSNWIQCERPECQKWRRIPWHVDIDMLSESFVCADNIWNPSSASCAAVEDSWDEHADAWIDADGTVKLESDTTEVAVSVPTSELLSGDTEIRTLDFQVGAQFDVFLVHKERWVRATVVDTDISSQCKRAEFSFPRTSNKNEWVDLNSGRIAPFLMHTSKGSKNRQRRRSRRDKKADASGKTKSMDETNPPDVGSMDMDGEDDSFEGDTETSGDESTDIRQDNPPSVQIDDGLNDFGDDDASAESREKRHRSENDDNAGTSDALRSTLTTVTEESTPSRLEDKSDSRSPEKKYDSSSLLFSIPKKRQLTPESNRIPKKKPTGSKECSAGELRTLRESPSSKKQNASASETSLMRKDARQTLSKSSVPSATQTSINGNDIFARGTSSSQSERPCDPRLVSQRHSIEHVSSPGEKEVNTRQSDKNMQLRQSGEGTHQSFRNNSRNDSHHQGLHRTRTNAFTEFSHQDNRRGEWYESRKAHQERPKHHPNGSIRNRACNPHGPTPRFDEQRGFVRPETNFFADRDRLIFDHDSLGYRDRWSQDGSDRAQYGFQSYDQIHRHDGDRCEHDRNHYMFDEPRSMERGDDYSMCVPERLRNGHDEYTRPLHCSPRGSNEGDKQSFGWHGYGNHEEIRRHYSDDVDRRPPMGYDLDYDRRPPMGYDLDYDRSRRNDRSGHVRHRSDKSGHENRRGHSGGSGREDQHKNKDSGDHEREDNFEKGRGRDQRTCQSPEVKPEKVKRQSRGYKL